MLYTSSMRRDWARCGHWAPSPLPCVCLWLARTVLWPGMLLTLVCRWWRDGAHGLLSAPHALSLAERSPDSAPDLPCLCMPSTLWAR